MQPTNLLNLEDKKLKLPYELLYKIKENSADIDQATDDLHLYQDIAHPDYEPYYLFFLANVTANAIQYKDDTDKIQIAHNLEKATRMFRRLGEKERWNEAIVHWQYGLFYLTEGKKAFADRELLDAKKLLTKIGAMSEWQGDYNRRDTCWNLIQQIEHDLRSVANIQIASTAIPATFPFVLPIDVLEQLAFPVYGSLYAGPHGNFIFDDEMNDASFEGPFINNIEYRVYNIKAKNTDDPIHTTSTSEPVWFRVTGNSMNNATPVPIEDGDLVLVNANLHETENDIVAAALIEPTSIADRAGIIKRFTRHGLVSESTVVYKEIRLSEVSIQGVVIAVAKAIEVESESDEIIDEAQSIYANSSIKGIIDNKMLLFGTYQIEAGVSHKAITKQQNKYQIPFELLIYADGMKIGPLWHQQLSLDLASSSNFIEFSVMPTEIGMKDILIEYFYKRHWLGRIKHTVEVLERVTI